MAARKNGFTLRITDMTDREVLGLIYDQADEEGYTQTPAIASALWPRIFNGSANAEAQKSAVQAVGVRLGWMRRYGVVERAEGYGRSRWALTLEGENLLNGKLTAPQASALKSLKGASLVLAVGTITERPADEMVATLMRRQWIHGTGRR